MLLTQNLLDLIGRPNFDLQVKHTLKLVSLDPEKVKLKRGDYQIGLPAYDYGIDVIFTDPREFGLSKNFPEGTLLCSAIFFFNEGIQQHKKYSHELPKKLNFTLGRSHVRELLGMPELINQVFPIDRWSWDKLRLFVTYADDYESIVEVCVDMPEIA